MASATLSALIRLYRRPVLAPLLAHPQALPVLAGVGAFTLLMGWLRISWMPCPFLQVTGVPCPGCGLTRACVLLLKGKVHDALHLHAFAPAFVMLILGLAAVLLVPAAGRKRLIGGLEKFERRTAILPLLLTLLMFYWLIRRL